MVKLVERPDFKREGVCLFVCCCSFKALVPVFVVLVCAREGESLSRSVAIVGGCVCLCKDFPWSMVQHNNLSDNRHALNGVHRCTNSRQVAREPTEPLPRRKCALDIPGSTSSTALLTTFDLLKGNFTPKRLGNVTQRQRWIRIMDSTAALGRASG